MEIEDVAITPEAGDRTTVYFPPDLDLGEGREAFRTGMQAGMPSSVRMVARGDEAALLFRPSPDLEALRYVPGDEIAWVVIPGTEARGEVDVPLLRLHRPRHEGCEASYGFGREQSHDVSVKFTFGMSIGRQASVTSKATRTYDATEHCVEVISRATVHVAQYNVLVDGAQIARIWRADVVDCDFRVRDPRELAPEDDGCQVPFDEARHLAEFESDDMRGPGDPGGEMALELERTTKASVELAPGFGDTLKAKLELGLERTTSDTTSISAKLTPGARYSVYVPRTGNTMERCWTTD